MANIKTQIFSFSPEAKAQENVLVMQKLSLKARVQIKYETYVIDSERTTLCEDAISCGIDAKKGPYIEAHFPDIASFIPKNSPLDQAINVRGQTIHENGKPPSSLFINPKTATKFSLHHTSSRPAMTVRMFYDEAYAITGTEIFQSLLTNTVPLLHQKAKNVFKGGAETYPRLHFLAEIISRMPDAIQPKQNKSHLARVQQTVNNVLVAAKQQVAHYAKEHDIPVIFENNTAPHAEYYTANPPASGVLQASFTKPLHAAAHLYNQRMVLEHLAQHPKPNTAKETAAYVAHFNTVRAYVETRVRPPSIEKKIDAPVKRILDVLGPPELQTSPVKQSPHTDHARDFVRRTVARNPIPQKKQYPEVFLASFIGENGGRLTKNMQTIPVSITINDAHGATRIFTAPDERRINKINGREIITAAALYNYALAETLKEKPELASTCQHALSHIAQNQFLALQTLSKTTTEKLEKGTLSERLFTQLGQWAEQTQGVIDGIDKAPPLKR